MSDATPAHAARRGRPPLISRELVLDAALSLGIADVSVKAVARRLGVTTTAVYRYFPTRETLLLDCLDVVVGQLTPPAAANWRDRLRAFATAVWNLCAAHPGVPAALLAVGTTPPSLIALMTATADTLVEDGRSPEQALLAVDFAFEVALSSHMYMAATGSPSGGGFRDSWRGQPVYGRIADPDALWQGTGWFDEKIEIVIAGLAASS